MKSALAKVIERAFNVTASSCLAEDIFSMSFLDFMQYNVS